MLKETNMITQEQTRYAWDAVAEGYDEYVTPMNLSLAEETLRLVDLQGGMRFLDVAAGTGALSLPAARMGAQVVATDISPVMIERLKARARDEGLTNLEARVMDGQALELEDGGFDVTASQYGVMLMPDLPKALGEMARVTRPGGRVLVTTMGPPTQIEFLKFFFAAMKSVVPDFTGLPQDPPPLPFQVSDPDKLRQEMAAAGLKDIRVEKAVQEVEFQSGAQWWNCVIHSNPIGAQMVADLTEEQAHAVRHVMDNILRERAGSNGAAILNNHDNIAIGTR